MDQLIIMRAKIITIYKRFETPIVIALKFLAGLYIFASINGFFAKLGVPYAEKLDKFIVVLFAAVLTAILPPVWLFVLIWLIITVHIFFVSLELSVIAGLLLLCLILFYIRIFPKESYLILLLVFCFHIKIPYLVPLFAGMFVGISSVGAMIIGVLIWYALPSLSQFSASGSTLDGLNVLSLPQTFADTYSMFVKTFTADSGWIHMALIFVLAVIAVRIVSTLPFNYSMEIGLALGALVLLIGVIAGGVSGNFDGIKVSVFGAFVSIIISTALAFACKFFDMILDYNGTERLSFQDDDYMYFVKAVPKIKIDIDTDDDNDEQA